MARYIDADALIKDMRSRKYIDKALCEIFETIVDNTPTAYDAEAVVKELENLNDEYVHHCTNNDWQRGFIDGAKVAIMKAISIVRGKE